MFTVYRFIFRYGHEWDPMDVTVKEFETFEKAAAYVDRYARGLKYCSAQIENEAGSEVAYHSADRGWYINGQWV